MSSDLVELQNFLSKDIKKHKELKELEEEYSELAQEFVSVKIIGDTLYIFGSGLACLKILFYLKEYKDVRCDYSISLKSYFVAKAIEET